MNKKFTAESVIQSLIQLKNELGHEPTAQEIDRCPYTPSSRQIQRRFGGLKDLRQSAGFAVFDHTSGATRAQKAHRINQRSNEYHQQVINRLFEKHHNPVTSQTSVVREYAYQQWLPDAGYYKNIACDVAVIDGAQSHITLIDFFFPQDSYSFGGCVRQKHAKLRRYPVSLFGYDHTVLFVCMNPAFDESYIAKIYQQRGGVEVISYQKFQELFLT